jgi:two-component system sensor histidine kinase BaeS
LVQRVNNHLQHAHTSADSGPNRAGGEEKEQQKERLSPRRHVLLGVQLALAFVAVALVAVAVTSATGSLIVFHSIHQLVTRQEERTARGAALGAATTYRPVGWAARLKPEIAVVDMSGSKMQCTDKDGEVIGSSSGYSGFSGPALTKQVLVHGRRVGTVTVKFGTIGSAGAGQSFITQRWESRFIAGGAGVLFALIAASIIGPLITAPVGQVLRAARARSTGQRQARVGRVRGLRDLRRLAATFDRMADNLGREDQLCRNVVAYIAHDLRTPIAVLRASTEAILDGVTPITRASVESLHDEVMNLGQMVEDLRLLSAAEAASLQLKMSRCDLAVVAEDTADSLASIFDAAGVRLVRHLSSVSVLCDEVRMRQIITNLLTNTAKFTAAGGQVTIEVRPAGYQAVVRVSDTGIGIRPDDLPHLTERFFRGHGSERIGGSGIGLTIVDELVRAHRGTVDIASELGEGTQVTITIPREP